MSGIDETIRLAQATASATPRESALWGMNVHNLAHLLHKRYLATGAVADLDEALRLAQDVVDTGREDDRGWPIYLGLLGLLLGSRFDRTDNLSDIDEGIQRLSDAVKITPENNRRWSIHAHNLGCQYGRRYKRTGHAEDLDDAIRMAKAALAVTLPSHEHWPAQSSQLADLLGFKFEINGDLAILEEAIEAAQEAVNVALKDGSGYAAFLHTLGILFGHKSQGTRSITDLQTAIDVLQEAAKLTKKGATNRPFILNSLANLLSDKFSKRSDRADLEGAIQVTEDSLEEIFENHPSRAMFLNNLGRHLGTRFREYGDMKDLDDSIRVTQEAVRSTSSDHMQLAAYLQNLGDRLSAKFRRTGDDGSLDQSIKATRAALELTPEDNPARAGRLHNLAVGLWDRSQRTGAITELEEAIKFQQTAVDIISQNHPQRGLYLNGLGLQFASRFAKVGAIDDLHKAIAMTQEAVRVTSEKHSDWAIYANNLANQLGLRYQRIEELDDLNEAIRTAKMVVDASPPDHVDRPMHLHNLGHWYMHRYHRKEDAIDLDQAILYAAQAVETTDEDHPNWPLYLNTLGSLSRDRFFRTGAIEDIDGAVYAGKTSIAVLLEDNPNWAKYTLDLGISLGCKFAETKDLEELDECLYFEKNALKHTNSPVSIRILAGKSLLMTCAAMSNWQGAYEAAKASISLVPKLTSRSLQNSDKQYLLAQLVGFASNGAAMALNLEMDPINALDLLEQGRGVLAATLEESRMDILDIKEKHPELAQKFIHLREEIESALEQNVSLPEAPGQAPARSLYDINNDTDELIEYIRKHPGFEDFLLTPSKEKLLAAAEYGPLVVVNVSEYRCDAILIEQDQIRCLPLPELHYEEINEKAGRSNLSTCDILEWLWRTVASPVLDELGFTHSAKDDDWPHIWWIPTGALTKMPLHAAGYHDDSRETVLDRVMSSYSPSIKALIHSRSRPNPKILPTAPVQALLVAMDKTPGLSETYNLPFATSEVEMLEQLCSSMPLIPIRPAPRKHEVASLMPNCRVFHFAGHGHAFTGDPSKSRLLLEDWKTDPLTVGSMLATDLRRHAPFLAYLSACSTSQVRDARFVDESIHLISGYQLAGFRHVIGTLWEVNDELCVDMARLTYEGMRDRGMTDEAVCRGLHDATREFRRRWSSERRASRRASEIVCAPVVSELRISASRSVGVGCVEEDHLARTLIPLDNDEEQPESLLWVPYVHFGV